MKKLSLKIMSLPCQILNQQENKKFRKVDDLIFLRKQQLAKLDELVKARFVEMFGDINVNNKKWMTYPLGELLRLLEAVHHVQLKGIWEELFLGLKSVIRQLEKTFT